MTNKVCLVIGACDATGGAVAKRFAREGFAVCATRRTVEKIEPLIASIRRHSTNGWLSPAAFERLHYQSLEDSTAY